MDDRIKLAEAMGISLEPYHPTDDCDHRPNFDPFTDANDDYAVLEWMRKIEADGGRLVYIGSMKSYYQIGDYARAALKVIK